MSGQTRSIGAALVVGSLAARARRVVALEHVERRMVGINCSVDLAAPLCLVAKCQGQHGLVRIGLDGLFQQIKDVLLTAALAAHLVGHCDVGADLAWVKLEGLLVRLHGRFQLMLLQM